MVENREYAYHGSNKAGRLRGSWGVIAFINYRNFYNDKNFVKAF